MINFERKTLFNGLRILIHQDVTNPLASVNIHYLVGSKDDPPNQTGLAHLFEHLMFGGTKKVPSYDLAVQNAGGENNAFTTTDSTNYHITIPAENIELALFLEADRMSGLKLNQTLFNREKQVVLEEYKETCLNKPYGDSFHLISALAYSQHPYRWPTIGLNEKHIRRLSLVQARIFYKKYYQPANAILSITSKFSAKKLLPLIEKYFDSIQPIPVKLKPSIKEPQQTKMHRLTSEKKSPADAIYMAFHMASRVNRDFYIADLISDILSNGQSTRLYKNLVRGKQLVSTVDAYITASIDPGLFILEAKAIPGVSIKKVEQAIWDELKGLKNKLVPVKELTKMKNTIESSLEFSEINGLNKAITLGFFEMLGDANRTNQEFEIYKGIHPDDIQRVAKDLFRTSNCSIVSYRRAKDGPGFFEEEEDDD